MMQHFGRWMNLRLGELWIPALPIQYYWLWLACWDGLSKYHSSMYYGISSWVRSTMVDHLSRVKSFRSPAPPASLPSASVTRCRQRDEQAPNIEPQQGSLPCVRCTPCKEILIEIFREMGTGGLMTSVLYSTDLTGLFLRNILAQDF